MGVGVEFAYEQVEPLLRRVADLDLVLIVGQAVNFWAEIYAHRVSELEASSPYTSKDIDFCGDRKAVSVCADRLGAKAVLAALDESTPNSGVIVVPLAQGALTGIDP